MSFDTCRIFQPALNSVCLPWAGINSVSTVSTSSKRHFPQLFSEDALLPEIFALKRASSLPSEATRERDSFYPSTSGSNPLGRKPWSHNGCRSSWHRKNRYCSAGGKWSQWSECCCTCAEVDGLKSRKHTKACFWYVFHSHATPEVVNLLFHNFPDQKIVLVAHSNQALNDLFEKIVALDIPERYLLRLGRGIEDRERGSLVSGTVTNIITSMFLKKFSSRFWLSERKNGCMCPTLAVCSFAFCKELDAKQDFSKWGRVNHMLPEAQELYVFVQQILHYFDTRNPGFRSPIISWEVVFPPIGRISTVYSLYTVYR